MASDPLSNLQRAAVRQVVRDARGSKRVTRHAIRRDADLAGPAPDHPEDVRAVERTLGETSARVGRAEEHPVPVVSDAGRLKVRFQVLLQLVIHGHLQPVTALLVESQWSR